MTREILVIEDNADALMLYRRVLEMENFKVGTATSGQEALDSLENNCCPDLILLDLSMPGLSGEEFIEKLRQNPDWANLKIIIASGWDSLESRAKALKVDGYVQKPVDIDELLGAIQTCLT